MLKLFGLYILLLVLITHLTSLRLSASFGMSVMSSYQEQLGIILVQCTL